MGKKISQWISWIIMLAMVLQLGVPAFGEEAHETVRELEDGLTLAIFGLYEFMRERPVLLGVALLAAPACIVIPVGQRPGFPDFLIGFVPSFLMIVCSFRGVGKG